jgi:HEAT repeat protein
VNHMQDILSALKSPDEELRRGVIESLRGKDLSETCEYLFIAMGDDSWRVRKEAVQVFVAAYPSGDLIDALLDQLRNEHNAGLRNSAAEAVIILGSRAVQHLIRLAGDSDSGVRKFVIDVMGGIGSSEFVPVLLKSLYDSDVNVSAAAAEHLGTIGNASVVPELIRTIVANEEIIFRFSALAALGRLGTPGPVPEEIKNLVGQEILNKVIFDCLGSIGDHSAAPLLQTGFLSSQKSARCAAVKSFSRILQRSDQTARQELEASLRRLSGGGVVPAFIEIFDVLDPDVALTEALTLLLGIIGDVRAAAPLLAAYVTERLSNPALMALKNLGTSGMDALIGIYPNADDDIRRGICDLVAELSYHAGDELIRLALRDPSPSVRSAAVNAAGKSGLSDCLPEIIRLLDEADDELRSTIISCLQSLAQTDRAPVLAVARQLADSDQSQQRRDSVLLFATLGDGKFLLRLVKDEDPAVRQASVSAIGKLNIPSSQKILRIALVDETPEVRMASAEALGSAGDAAAIAPLTLTLGDDDDRVRCTALKSITRLAPENALEAIRAVLPTAKGLLLITCLELLDSLGSSGALTLVEEALYNDDEELVNLAIEIISRHARERIERHTERLLRHPEASVRLKLATALAELPSEQARKHLALALEKERNNLVRDRIRCLLEGIV